MSTQAMNFRTFSSLEEAAEYHSGNVIEHAAVMVEMEEGQIQETPLQIVFDETQEFTAEEFERIIGKLEGIDVNGVVEISAQDLGIAPVEARPEITGEVETRNVSGKLLNHVVQEPIPGQIFSADIENGNVSQDLIQQIMARAPPAPRHLAPSINTTKNEGEQQNPEDFRSIEFRPESLGISIDCTHPVGLWQVQRLSRNKQAERKRVQVGWTVVEINGRVIDENFKDEAEAIMKSKEKCTITFDTSTKDLRTIKFEPKTRIRLHLEEEDEMNYGRVLKASEGCGIRAGALLIGIDGQDFELGSEVGKSEWSERYFTFDISEEIPKAQPAKKNTSIFGNLNFSWTDFTMTQTVKDDGSHDTTIAM